MSSGNKNKAIVSKVEDMDQFSLKLGTTLYEMRKASGLNQMEVAKILGIQQAGYSRIESGFQNLKIHELIIIANLYDQKPDNILAYEPNLWQISKKFGRAAPLSDRYKIFSHSKVRELFPYLMFLRMSQSEKVAEAMIESLDLTPIYYLKPDDNIGVYAILDLITAMIKEKYLSKSTLDALIQSSIALENHDKFGPIYRSKESALSIAQELVLNAHNYQKNYLFELSATTRNQMTVVVNAANHMREVKVPNEAMGDILCQYWSGQIANSPKIIKLNPLKIQHKQCLFKGDSHCTYELKL